MTDNDNDVTTIDGRALVLYRNYQGIEAELEIAEAHADNIRKQKSNAVKTMADTFGTKNFISFDGTILNVRQRGDTWFFVHKKK